MSALSRKLQELPSSEGDKPDALATLLSELDGAARRWAHRAATADIVAWRSYCAGRRASYRLTYRHVAARKRALDEPREA